VLLIVVGVQLFSLGLLGQMMVVNRRAGAREELVRIEKVLSPGIDPDLNLSRLESAGTGR